MAPVIRWRTTLYGKESVIVCEPSKRPRLLAAERARELSELNHLAPGGRGLAPDA